MVKTKIFSHLLVLLAFVILGCPSKKEEPKKDETYTKSQQTVATPGNEKSDKDDGLEELKDSEVDQLPVAKEWAAIWKADNVFKALKAFEKKHGLFLETTDKFGDASIQSGEGPCGETYASLVKDTKDLTGKAWEIDEKGKTLREWQPGTDDIISIEKNTLYRKVNFYETLSNFSMFAPKEVIKHTYMLGINSDNTFALQPEDTKIDKWETKEMKCPADLKVESEFKYCVKEKKTNRIFVLQHPCT